MNVVEILTLFDFMFSFLQYLKIVASTPSNMRPSGIVIYEAVKLIFADFNINSIRNKFDFVVKSISSNVDLLMLSQTKLMSLLKGQFLIKGFGDPSRIDRNVNVEEILFYVREDIPIKLHLLKPYQKNAFQLKLING